MTQCCLLCMQVILNGENAKTASSAATQIFIHYVQVILRLVRHRNCLARRGVPKLVCWSAHL